MVVRNKWTGYLYEVKEMKKDSVVLVCLEDNKTRSKGEVFTIAKQEFFFNYVEKITKK